jgi:plasmid stabilization system protein ParE
MEIQRYHAREGGAMAADVIEDVMTGIERLAAVPLSGARPRDARLRELGFRYLIRNRYLVFYRTGTWGVRVYRVLHQRRAYERLL